MESHGNSHISLLSCDLSQTWSVGWPSAGRVKWTPVEIHRGTLKSIVAFVPRFYIVLHTLSQFQPVTHSAVRCDRRGPPLATTLTLIGRRVGEECSRRRVVGVVRALGILSVSRGLYVCADPARGPSARFHHHQEVDWKRACSHDQESPQSG